ncbi:pentapeptide repeat-containing protein [Psychrobacter sp. FME13]|uniref:pentapeptide repeat-containing protein n=1 Tax=Psychrobacter sp. FME13 TaxID=2487708 RepID=UPI0017889CD9|nr:pentapeptide repeat-containing protein [Psychrobacter sp. FME13]MBE0441210.1 pentapeptide repeat-containing protein [Psychrobacter sp. FME13]
MTKTAKFSHEVEIFNHIGEKICCLSYKSTEDDKPVIRKLEYENKKLSDLIINNLVIEFGEFDYTEFIDINITSTDLVGIIATDATLIDCEVLDSIVYACTLYGSIFKKCIFKNVLFRGVNLAASVFNNCTFDNCKFTSDHINHFTDLTETRFINCSIKRTIFDDIDIDENTILPQIGKQ